MIDLNVKIRWMKTSSGFRNIEPVNGRFFLIKPNSNELSYYDEDGYDVYCLNQDGKEIFVRKVWSLEEAKTVMVAF